MKFLRILTTIPGTFGQGEKAEWRNSGKDITINLHKAIIVFTGHAVGFMCMEIYALQGHMYGNLCLARAHVWKFMPCKGVATIEATEAAATVKVQP